MSDSVTSHIILGELPWSFLVLLNYYFAFASDKSHQVEFAAVPPGSASGLTCHVAA